MTAVKAVLLSYVPTKACVPSSTSVIKPITKGSVGTTAPGQSNMVVVPMTDTFALHADNSPTGETQEARISIYTQGSYTKAKNAVVKALLRDDFTITGRQYIGYETSTGYHHYNVDVDKYYELEE